MLLDASKPKEFIVTTTHTAPSIAAILANR